MAFLPPQKIAALFSRKIEKSAPERRHFRAATEEAGAMLTVSGSPQ
jgi:hypothetical protein